MLFGDGLGDGQPHSKAAGKGPGPVRPVKAVKEPFQLQRSDLGVGILHREDRVPSQAERHLDRPARVAVFQGVIQQDGRQPPDQRLVSAIGHTGLHGRCEGLVPFRRQGLEFRDGIGNRAAQIKGCTLQRGLALIHPGQGDHLVDKQAHPLPFAADVVQPLVLSHLRLHDIQIGQDQGQGRLQFVVGIRNKLLLLFITLRDGAHRPLGENDSQAQDQEGAPQQDQKSGKEQTVGHVLIHSPVDEHYGGARVGPDHLVAVICDPAPLRALLHGALHIVFHLRLRDGGDGVNVDPGDLLPFIEPDRKKAGAELGLGRNDVGVGEL